MFALIESPIYRDCDAQDDCSFNWGGLTETGFGGGVKGPGDEEEVEGVDLFDDDPEGTDEEPFAFLGEGS